MIVVILIIIIIIIHISHVSSTKSNHYNNIVFLQLNSLFPRVCKFVAISGRAARSLGRTAAVNLLGRVHFSSSTMRMTKRHTRWTE